MKNILVLLILFHATSLCAQEDRFSDINQVKGKDIYITDNSALNVAFSIIESKVKPIRKIKKSNITLAGKTYHAENKTYTYKKKNYVVLKGVGETILLKEEDAPLYLSSFVSKTYWQEKFESYKNDYTYLNFKKYYQVHSSEATIEYDDLTRIEWMDVEPTSNGAIFYMSEYSGLHLLEKFKITSTFFEESKDIYFIKKDNIQPYIEKYKTRLAKEKREKEIADSIDNSKLRLAIALDEAQFVIDDRTIYVNKGDTIAVFSYLPLDDKYIVRFHHENLLFESENIEFLDTKTTTTEGQYSWDKKTVKSSDDADYLKKKGDEGKEQRLKFAAEYDDFQTNIWINKALSIMFDYYKDVTYKKNHQIFLTGIGYVFDNNEYSSQFGMYFDVYNCFSKTIKYVEFTLTNYNAVGDVQIDYIGRSSRTVKGIGPIEPKEGGRYTWDDIFWDYNDIIRETRLTRIKFIFKDGTTKVFSGYNNINKHMTSDAWD